MARFRYFGQVLGGFRLMMAEPKAGDFMPIRCDEHIPAKKSGTCFVVPRGRVEYTTHPEGFNAVPIVPGVSSEAFGPRLPGDYMMTAIEDSQFICVSVDGSKRPFHREDVQLAAGDPYTVEMGSVAILTKGEYELDGKLVQPPHVLYARMSAARITAVSDSHLFVVSHVSNRPS